MAIFQTALGKTLLNEGGFYHNNLSGEITNRGISAQFLYDTHLLPPSLAKSPIRAKLIQSGPDLGSFTLLPGGQVATKAERDTALAPLVSYIYLLTVADVTPIYLKYFWTPMLGDQINPQPIADKLFDLRVNMGPGTANILLQEAINESQKIMVAVDSVIGPYTVKAVNDLETVEPGALLARFRGLAEEHYKQIYVELSERGEATESELEGWLNRLAKC
jgi:hypothetical protein